MPVTKVCLSVTPCCQGIKQPHHYGPCSSGKPAWWAGYGQAHRCAESVWSIHIPASAGDVHVETESDSTTLKITVSATSAPWYAVLYMLKITRFTGMVVAPVP